MLRNPEYNEFLDYMCPAARGLGITPPPGTDSALCPRPILGTWDDHDFGWNDGDGRLENKWVGAWVVGPRFLASARTFFFCVFLMCVRMYVCFFLLLVLCSVRVTPLCPGPVLGAWDDLIRGLNSGHGGAWRGIGLLGRNSFLHLPPCFVCTRVCIVLL